MTRLHSRPLPCDVGGKRGRSLLIVRRTARLYGPLGRKWVPARAQSLDLLQHLHSNSWKQPFAMKNVRQRLDLLHPATSDGGHV